MRPRQASAVGPLAGWPGVIALVVAVAYLGLIASEDGAIGLDALLVFALIAGPGVMGLHASRSSDADWALGGRAAAAGALLSMGWLGILTIGLPLLVAGAAFAVGAVRAARSASRWGRLRAGSWALGAAILPWLLLFF